jgi:hypothetical protein
MIVGHALRDQQRELIVFRNRLMLSGLFIAVAFAILLARFSWLQVVQSSYYHALAEQNRISVVPVVPNRGLILDRNGEVLAANYSAYTLEITPSRVANVEHAIDELSRVIDVSPRDRRRFKKLQEESKNFESLPIRTRLTEEEVARFAVSRFRFPGFEIKARPFRSYPQGEIASHAIGYIGRINEADVKRIDTAGLTANYKGTDHIGKLGIEGAYEKELHGLTGSEQVEIDAGGRASRSLSRSAPVSGNNIVLTLDLELQKIAGRSGLSRRAGGHRSEDGRHPALVSAGFDPNLFVDDMNSTEEWPQQLARAAAQQQGAARPVPAGLDHQAVHGARRPRVQEAHAGVRDFRSGLLLAAGRAAPLPRPQEGRARLREHAQGDRRFVRHVLLRPGDRARHRLDQSLPHAVRFRAAHGHRYRGRGRQLPPSPEWKQLGSSRSGTRETQ